MEPEVNVNLTADTWDFLLPESPANSPMVDYSNCNSEATTTTTTTNSTNSSSSSYSSSTNSNSNSNRSSSGDDGGDTGSSSNSQACLVRMYLDINGDDLKAQGYKGELNSAKRKARSFILRVAKRLHLDVNDMDEQIGDNEKVEWSFIFDAEFQYETATKLQATLRDQFRMIFGDLELGGNVIRVEKKCYRVVVVGTFGLFQAFKAKEQEFHTALRNDTELQRLLLLSPGVGALTEVHPSRAQLDSLMHIIRCPKAVAQMLQASAQALAEAVKVNSTLQRLGLNGCTGSISTSTSSTGSISTSTSSTGSSSSSKRQRTEVEAEDTDLTGKRQRVIDLTGDDDIDLT